WEQTRGAVRPIPLESGRPPLLVSSRLYAQARHHQLVYYWTQRGAEVLPDGTEPRATLLSEYAWIAELLRGREPMARQARRSVLVGTDVVGPTERTETKLQTFTAALAGEVYQLCPWAVPVPGGQ